MTSRRVAVTGLGVIAPLGNSIDQLFANLEAGHSGVHRLSTPWATKMQDPIGASADFDGSAHFAAPRLRILDRVSQLALVAGGKAVADARLDFSVLNRDRCGIFLGTGMGGAQTSDDSYRTLYAQGSDRIEPYTVLGAMTNAPAAWLGIDHGVCGPILTYSTACSSSAVAIGEAARRIQSDELDIAIAGGAEAPLVHGVMRAWKAMRTLASQDPIEPSASCRPFSQNRTGLVLGEGSAFAVLEDWNHATERGVKIYAELVGYGLTSDVVHITRPSCEGQSRAMRAALASAHLDAGDVDYINAHGTATQQNDAVETEAIKAVFGARAHSIPISSTKSMHGHLLGAAGALEFVISVMCLQRGVVPPTMHLNVKDPACDLDYVAGQARRGISLNLVMSNSFAFGGTNAVLLVKSAHSN